VQAAVQRSSNDDGAVIVNPATSRDIMTEVLRSTINIPPTVTKQHGDRIAVVVARDLDFRSVYELRPAALSR
jgi:type IV secretion system protein VirB10